VGGKDLRIRAHFTRRLLDSAYVAGRKTVVREELVGSLRKKKAMVQRSFRVLLS